MNPQLKPSILLYSDANFFAINIFENLLSKNCVVNIVTNDVKDWKNKTSHLSVNNKFSIVDRRNLRVTGQYNYAVFCGGFLNLSSAYDDYFDFTSLINFDKAKILLLFPSEAFDRNQVDKINLSNNTALLFVGDMLGPRINLESDLLMPRLLSEILWKRKITLAVGEVLSPIFVADAVRVVVRWLFSFGPYGKVTLLSGNQTSGDTFWVANKKYFENLELKYDLKLPIRPAPKNTETEIINSNLNYSLNETYNWLKSSFSKHSEPPVEKKERIKKIIDTTPDKKWGGTPKKYKTVIWGLFFLFAFPFLTLLISLLVSFMAYKSFISGKDNLARNSFLASRAIAVVSEKESVVLGYIPGVGRIYREAEFGAGIIRESNSIGIHLVPFVRDMTQMIESVLGNKVYDAVAGSQKIESGIAILYNDIVTTKTMTSVASEKNIILAKKLLSKIDFERLITLVSNGRIIAGTLPEMLGQDTSKTYLLLFENNMELRPTGGFIGSFGLVTFEKGRLTDLTVNDVYSADGQLNGHVEPPLPIKNYLGEANWWLRDSNWDPDFPTSAKRAEWFLDKELSKRVDGVVAIDLFPIKETLKSTGPIFLSDYNMDITADNLYEKTQSEVENNFFPGTHKKASFLTALSRNLLGEVTKLKPDQKLGVLNASYNGLNGRHIQIYLHDNTQQEAFSSLGWDGAVATPTCGADCYADMVGLVEANVGMNKVNYFIQRNISFDATVSDNKINHKLTLTIKNTANPALGPSSRYKNYLRILIPSDSTFTSVISYNGNTRERLTPEPTEAKGHKEIGVLVEILAGNTKDIEFSWTSGTGETLPFMNYGLYIRKQAGTDADPINVNIEGMGLQTNPDPRLTLTRQGGYSYNTTLVQDLFFRLSR